MATTTDSTSTAGARGPERSVVRTAAEDVRAFKAARRHTWFVRALKFVLPLGALALVGAYSVILRASFGVNIGGVNVEKLTVTADDLKMKNPSYFGTTTEGGKYTVRAREAVMTLKQTEPIKLTGIDGDLTQADGTLAHLTAIRGTLDNQKGELELLDQVDIETTTNMRARMRQAKVYTKEGRITSEGSVHAEMPAGQITARRMELLNKERKGTFSGDVTLRLVQAATPDGRSPAIATGRDARQPVDLKSEELLVDDSAKVATFKRRVTAVQGETTLQAAELRVTYEGKIDPAALGGQPGAAAAVPATPGQAPSGLSKIAARGGVVITAGTDRRVSSEAVDFDVKADTALFTGNVQIAQARNQLRGRRLALDRKTGKSRLDAPAEPGIPAGRIAATFFQGDPGKPAATAAKAGASEGGNPLTFKTDPNAPMDIDAESLDLNDTARVATFKGAVRAQQGDFQVRAAEIVAHYSGSAGLSGADAAPKPGDKGGAELTRVEARQNVLITSKDGQTAKGETALFDTKANTVTLTGRPVVVTQEKTVIECAKLLIDMTTGLSNCLNNTIARNTGAPADGQPGAAPSIVPVPSPNGGAGQMKMIFYPNQVKDQAKQKRELPAAPPAAPAANKQRAPAAGWEPSTSAAPAQRAPSNP